jgi:hypothetical protein
MTFGSTIIRFLLITGLLNITALKGWQDKFPHLRFHKSKETLDLIQALISNKQKGAYLRFGDGDINLALGQADMLQSPNPQLQQEMREAFLINHPNALKALPLYCHEIGKESGMNIHNHEASLPWVLDILEKAQPVWGIAIANVYTHVALHYTSTSEPEACIKFLKFLKNAPCFLFVGNQNVPLEIRELLFGSECRYVRTPPVASYSEIDRIEEECIAAIGSDDSYKVIVIAMGCSGRALQKRLWHRYNNIFLFDFGSLLDALCGWNTRAWIEGTNFNAPSFISQLKK